jgi:site-specific recombinase XerC
LADGAREEPIARALAAWAQRLEVGSPRTAKVYAREAQAFLAFIAQARGPLFNSLLNATPSDCLAFVHATTGLSASSRAVKAAVLRGLFAALVVEGLRMTNPADAIKVRHAQSGKHHRAVPRGLVIDVLRRLGASDDAQDVRDRALLLMTLNLAARRHEVGALNVGSMERDEGGKAHVQFTGKGSKSARMVIHASVVGAVDRWLAVGGHGGDPAAPLFFNVSHRPEHRGRRLTGAGIACIVKRLLPGFSPHCLRARSITDAWTESGKNLHVAQAFARHSTPAITASVYVQPESEEWAQGYALDYGALA